MRGWPTCYAVSCGHSFYWYLGTEARERRGFSLIASLSIVVVGLCRNCFFGRVFSYAGGGFLAVLIVTCLLGV